MNLLQRIAALFSGKTINAEDAAVQIVPIDGIEHATIGWEITLDTKALHYAGENVLMSPEYLTTSLVVTATSLVEQGHGYFTHRFYGGDESFLHVEYTSHAARSMKENDILRIFYAMYDDSEDIVDTESLEAAVESLKQDSFVYRDCTFIHDTEPYECDEFVTQPGSIHHTMFNQARRFKRTIDGTSMTEYLWVTLEDDRETGVRKTYALGMELLLADIKRAKPLHSLTM